MLPDTAEGLGPTAMFTLGRSARQKGHLPDQGPVVILYMATRSRVGEVSARRLRVMVIHRHFWRPQEPFTTANGSSHRGIGEVAFQSATVIAPPATVSAVRPTQHRPAQPPQLHHRARRGATNKSTRPSGDHVDGATHFQILRLRQQGPVPHVSASAAALGAEPRWCSTRRGACLMAGSPAVEMPS